MLESKQVTKAFGSKIAVDHVDLKLEAGHIYALLGPNGSGKTTWMKMAAGLIKPTGGSVEFNGRPVDIDSRRYVAYMSTEPYFYSWMTVKSVGKYYQDFFADFSYERYLALLGKLRLNEEMKTRSLSSGMMAKLKIGVTLARDAKVYMLDEPFNGIDLLARDEIRACILESAKEDKLLLLSSHLVEEMEAIADRAVFISEGRLIENVDLEQLRSERGLSMADRYRQIYAQAEVDEK
ncbi:MAG: ABC transporter ATP-binding protein [Clostridiales bacterium]|nr:ABC transporter ATP-binding protein [Clostridiales bacterium]